MNAPFVQSFFDYALKHRIGEKKDMAKLLDDPFSYLDERNTLFSKIERILEKSHPKEKQMYDSISENLNTIVRDYFRKHISGKYNHKIKNRQH